MVQWNRTGQVSDIKGNQRLCGDKSARGATGYTGRIQHNVPMLRVEHKTGVAHRTNFSPGHAA